MRGDERNLLWFTQPKIVRNSRREFRSQTSNIWTDAAKVVGRVREERARRKKIKARERVEKLRNTVFFQCFEAPEGRKVGSLKRRVRKHLAGWEINLRPLWCEAHFDVKMPKTSLKMRTPLWCEVHVQVKMVKTQHVRITFGSWDVKKCTPLWREAHFKVNMLKTHHFRTIFVNWAVEKVHAAVARRTCRSHNVKTC